MFGVGVWGVRGAWCLWRSTTMLRFRACSCFLGGESDGRVDDEGT